MNYNQLKDLLEQHSNKLEKKNIDQVQSDQQLAELAISLRNDIESILGYKIISAQQIAQSLIDLNPTLMRARVIPTLKTINIELVWFKNLLDIQQEIITVTNIEYFYNEVDRLSQLYKQANKGYKDQQYFLSVAIEQVLFQLRSNNDVEQKIS